MIHVKNLPTPSDKYPVRRALLSVFDKTGLVDFARRLHAQGVDLVSTGGSARALAEAGLPVTEVSELTGFPEILDGRVKTLHPGVHAGLLARRTDPDDLAALEKLGFGPIDMVVVNLYPFEKATAEPTVTDAEAIENIDIGGPTMIRAAAKNFFFVAVVTSPDEYDVVASELEAGAGTLGMETRRRLAHQAFEHTAVYDRAISNYFGRRPSPLEEESREMPERFVLNAPRAQAMRYGENPHQGAALYGNPERFYRQLHGKELSFNNLMDLSAALLLIDEFRDADPSCAILKHTNPCGVASAATLAESYRNAFSTDRQSPFGGIVVVNRPLDLETAEEIDKIFTEIVIAPDYEEGVLALLEQKKNRRLIRSLAAAREDSSHDLRYVLGGLLVQERDAVLAPAATLRTEWRVVTERQPTPAELEDMDFGWRVCKHVKSNAIVYARDKRTLGVGAGQMSRIDSSEIAVIKGHKSELDFTGSVVASDAYFPFADGLIAAARQGATTVVQPGGSIRDDEVIAAANEYNMAMVFTGKRHFRH